MPFSNEGTLYVRDGRTKLEYQLPISNNTIDARSLRQIKTDSSPTSTNSGHGLRVFDPGLKNTAIMESEISSRDKNGQPIYRGYRLQDVWKCDFEDLFHLLIWGEIPTVSQKSTLQRKLTNALQAIPDAVVRVVQTFPKSSSPYPIVLAGLSAWLSTAPDSIPTHKGNLIYHDDLEFADERIIQTAAAYAAVLGLVFSHRKSINFAPARDEYSFYENLFLMIGVIDSKTGRTNPAVLDCFRQATVLTADNGMTQSTFTMLVTASAGGDPLSCLISAVSAAYGPLHIGAQEVLLQDLQTIGTPENVPAFLDDVKKQKRRLFGFGHRELTVRDPRVNPIEIMLEDLDKIWEGNPMLAAARELDRLATEDEYFRGRRLKANGDFYASFVLSAMGLDADMHVLMTIMTRVIGLLAHWRESMAQGVKLFRPLHVYTGREPGRTSDIKVKL